MVTTHKGATEKQKAQRKPANRPKTGAKPTKTSFKQGVSGNPAGRPRLTPEAVDLITACKGRTTEALAVLTEIMSNGENERNRITAAMAIIERGHGKPIQPTTIGNPDGTPIDMNMTLKFVKPA